MNYLLHLINLAMPTLRCAYLRQVQPQCNVYLPRSTQGEKNNPRRALALEQQLCS